MERRDAEGTTVQAEPQASMALPYERIRWVVPAIALCLFVMALFLAFLGFVSAEWFFRRRNHLV